MLRAADGILLSVVALLAIGVVMVSSAGLTIDPRQAVTVESILFSRASLYMVLAVAAMALASRLPVRAVVESPHFLRLAPLLLPLLIGVLLLAYVPGLGHTVNGARRWIRFPGTDQSMQPSEVAKWGVVVLLAWYAVARGPALRRFFTGLLPGLAIIAPFAAIIALEDLGTAVLVAAAGCVVLIAAGARVWHLLAFVPVGAAAFAAAVVTEPYRVKRLTTFLDPYAEPEGAGYHMIQSLVAVANGQGAGRGLGFGLQKFGYLPEDRTDFLFAVICEELGLAGAALVIALYAAVLWCGVSIVQRERSLALKLIGAGICATFGMQALMNLMVVTGLAPTKGIALPLLSYGGTGWILTAASLGILIAAARTQPEHGAETSAPERPANAHPPERTATNEPGMPASTAGAAV